MLLRPSLLAVLLGAVVLLGVDVALPAAADGATRPVVPIPPDHYTKAELTGFRSTPSYDETLAFLRRLEKTSPYLKVDFYGRSAEGRPMPCLLYTSPSP